MTAPPRQDATTYAVGGAVAARRAQLAVRAAVMADATRLWPLLDVKRLDQTFPGWLGAMVALIRNYHGQSAQAAASFYRSARATATASPAPESLIRFAAPPPREWMTKALGFAGPGNLTRDVARPRTALSTTLGTASRIALEGGRSTITETVKADPVAVGYFRVTDGDPCAFCALLASRGVVYKRDTVDFKSHNDCGCIGAPAFSRDQQLPDVSKTAAQVYLERGSGDALTAFRKAWNDRQRNAQAPITSPSR